MTRQSKCETCRERKVKCDEQRPVCGGCMKKSRPCHYKIGNALVNTNIGEQILSIRGKQVSGNAVILSTGPTASASSADEHESTSEDTKSLRLKYVHRTDDSQGLYVTFRRPGRFHGKPKRSTTHAPQSKSPTPAMLCQTTRMATQWASIIGYESIELNPLGEWLKLAWLAASEDTAVNLACEYTIISMTAFQSRDQVTLSRAYAAGGRAIQSLQAAVRACSGRESIPNLVLAILLHSAAEHFIKIGSFNYVAHFLGAGELLKMYQSMGGSERLLQVAARSSCADEMMEGIIIGREASMFEDTCRPPSEARIARPGDIDVSMEAVQYVLTRLPRLVYRAREVMEGGSPCDTDLIERIVALFKHDTNPYIETTLSMYSTTIKDPDDLKASPMELSLQFSSVRAFYVAVWYYFSQIIVCGLMQRLDEKHADGSAQLNIPAARVRDVAAARSLAMCVEYALKPTSSRPFIALALLGPLQLSTGAWLRLQRRQVSTETLEYGQAADMMEWSLTKAHIIEEMWQSAPATIERMAVMTDLFAGGPFVPNRGLQ